MATKNAFTEAERRLMEDTIRSASREAAREVLKAIAFPKPAPASTRTAQSVTPRVATPQVTRAAQSPRAARSSHDGLVLAQGIRVHERAKGMEFTPRGYQTFVWYGDTCYKKTGPRSYQPFTTKQEMSIASDAQLDMRARAVVLGGEGSIPWH